MLKKILQKILSQAKRVVIQVVKKCGRAGGCERRRAKALCGEKSMAAHGVRREEENASMPLALAPWTCHQ